jgi:hypothetical protein
LALAAFLVTVDRESGVLVAKQSLAQEATERDHLDDDADHPDELAGLDDPPPDDAPPPADEPPVEDPPEALLAGIGSPAVPREEFGGIEALLDLAPDVAEALEELPPEALEAIADIPPEVFEAIPPEALGKFPPQSLGALAGLPQRFSRPCRRKSLVLASDRQTTRGNFWDKWLPTPSYSRATPIN